jgi:glutaredoxin
MQHKKAKQNTPKQKQKQKTKKNSKNKKQKKQQKENPTTPMVFILQKNICHQKLKRDI